jgi:glycine cleavage system aminomethyltransferase T
MCYVTKKFTKTGTKIFVDVRGKPVEAVIQKPPFIEAGYYRGA